MKYTLENGKVVNISDKELDHHVKTLGITKDEAIQLWLEDNDYLDNDELEELDSKAKKVKIDHEASSITKETNKDKKPKTVKVSDEKKELFGAIYSNLHEIFGENAEIITENKLIAVKIGEKCFKIDLIEKRTPKNK